MMTDVHRLTTENAKEGPKVSAERLYAVLQASPVVALLHREMKIIYANPATVRLVQLEDAANLIGKSLLDFIRPDEHVMVKGRISLISKTGEASPPRRFKALTAQGGEIRVEAFGMLIDYDGGPAVLTMVTDITDKGLG